MNNSSRSPRIFKVCLILIFLFCGLGFLNLITGSYQMSIRQALSALWPSNSPSLESDIIWKVRLPRLLMSIILGGALALSGFLLQTFFSNPIAGPFILGISSGAKLAIVLAMVLSLRHNLALNSFMMIATAFTGAMLAMACVLILARRVRRPTILITSGVMIGYIYSAITDFVITFASDESIVNLHNWSQGSFAGASWENISILSIVISLATMLTFGLAKPISAYQLGESYAQSVGVNIQRFRLALVLLSSVLCASVTAFAGPISFVGVAVPHLIKTLTKTTKPLVLIPLCFLGGSVFCLGCDLIARSLFAPLEMNLSSVSSLLGAPIVIYIMARRRDHD